MRFFAFIFGLAALTFGLVMFVRIGNSERELNAKIQSIHDGKVQPETLTVVRKYMNANRHHGRGYTHVVFRTSRDPKVDCRTTQEFYDSVNTNSTVTGYNFQDGYFVPQSIGQDAGIAKWIFLGFGGLTGVGVMLVGFTSRKTRPKDGGAPPQAGSLLDLLTAIRNRGKRE